MSMKRKRKRAVLAILAASLVLVACGSSSQPALVAATTSPTHHLAAATPRAGNATLVATLPEVGTVYSRYNCTRGLRFALGIHLTGPQTAAVRLRTGSVSRVREVQPGQMSWFGYSPERMQWLAAAASGENGTVVGWVRVTGYPSSGRDCTPYMPPRVTIQVYPRRYYRLPDYPLLRHLIG